MTHRYLIDTTSDHLLFLESSSKGNGCFGLAPAFRSCFDKLNTNGYFPENKGYATTRFYPRSGRRRLFGCLLPSTPAFSGQRCTRFARTPRRDAMRWRHALHGVGARVVVGTGTEQGSGSRRLHAGCVDRAAVWSRLSGRSEGTRADDGCSTAQSAWARHVRNASPCAGRSQGL